MDMRTRAEAEAAAKEKSNQEEEQGQGLGAEEVLGLGHGGGKGADSAPWKLVPTAERVQFTCEFAEASLVNGRGIYYFKI